jgi:hypothetical protein
MAGPGDGRGRAALELLERLGPLGVLAVEVREEIAVDRHLKPLALGDGGGALERCRPFALVIGIFTAAGDADFHVGVGQVDCDGVNPLRRIGHFRILIDDGLVRLRRGKRLGASEAR